MVRAHYLDDPSIVYPLTAHRLSHTGATAASPNVPSPYTHIPQPSSAYNQVGKELVASFEEAKGAPLENLLMSEEETGKIDSTKDLEVDGSGDALTLTMEERVAKTLAVMEAQQKADEEDYGKAQELEAEKLRLAKEADEKAAAQQEAEVTQQRAQLKENLQHIQFELRGIEFDKERQEAEWDRLDAESEALEQQTKQIVAELALVGGSLSAEEEFEDPQPKDSKKGVLYCTRRNIHANAAALHIGELPLRKRGPNKNPREKKTDKIEVGDKQEDDGKVDENPALYYENKLDEYLGEDKRSKTDFPPLHTDELNMPNQNETPGRVSPIESRKKVNMRNQ